MFPFPGNFRGPWAAPAERSARRPSKPVMNRIKRIYYRVAEGLMRPVARTGIKPNHLTVAGLVLTAAVAAVVAGGFLVVGGILTLVATAFDSLDGSLARVTGSVTRFGAFFDASLDRYGDALLLAALYPSIPQDDLAAVFALFAALTGTFTVSYTKARANANGIDCDVGWFPREVRIVVYAAGLILNLVLPMIWLLAIATNVTAVHRIVHVWRATRADPAT